MKRTENQNKLPLIRILLLVFCAAVFLFAASQLLDYVLENHRSDEVQGNLAHQAVTVLTPTQTPIQESDLQQTTADEAGATLLESDALPNETTESAASSASLAADPAPQAQELPSAAPRNQATEANDVPIVSTSAEEIDTPVEEFTATQDNYVPQQSSAATSTGRAQHTQAAPETLVPNTAASPDPQESLPETQTRELSLPQQMDSASPDQPEETALYMEAPQLSPISYEIPIRVDFEILQAECADIVGWLYCADTPLNYPVVQAEDNEYYLHRLPDGSYNSNGTLFMDFRNLNDMSDRNTIVYGHNMNNGSMFGFLSDYKKQEFFEAHPTMWYLTPERAYRLDLLAGIITPSDSDTFELFSTDEDLMAHLEQAMQNSSFQSDVQLEDVQQVMTLSTCTYEYAIARYVIIASMLPAEYPPIAE